MDKVYTAWFKVGDEDRYLYLPEREIESWKDMEGFEIEETPCFCLEEAELKPEHDVMLKMMKIIRRRSLQEIKKSEADEHGYRFLSAEVRKHNESGARLCLMRKATPYSTKMNITVVSEMIINDLNNYYNGVLDYNESKTHRYGNVTTKDKIHYLSFGEDWYKNASPDSDASKFKRYLDEKGVKLGEPIVVDLKQLHANLGNGYYEVSYWATAPI